MKMRRECNGLLWVKRGVMRLLEVSMSKKERGTKARSFIEGRMGVEGREGGRWKVKGER